MNKTKRKIFETSLKLFAEKGYDATSIEDITATVGVAKGTLYYHFSSKEEIFNFLIEEGTKLLQNSIEIKIAKHSNYIDKIKAIVLIELKIVAKYEEIISILVSQFWGKEQRNVKCQQCIYEYITRIENIVQEGIESGQIKSGDAKIIASEIYGIICSTIVFKLKVKEDFDIMKLYYEYENTLINGLKIK
jgi:AcrR family transcriptional regulator